MPLPRHGGPILADFDDFDDFRPIFGRFSSNFGNSTSGRQKSPGRVEICQNLTIFGPEKSSEIEKVPRKIAPDRGSGKISRLP